MSRSHTVPSASTAPEGDHSTNPTHSTPLRAIAFGVVATLAVFVNLFEFTDIDRSTRHNYQALNVYPSGDLLEIGAESSTDFRGKYSMHLSLADLAPGSTVFVPDLCNASAQASCERLQPEYDLRLMSFGKTAAVERTSWTGTDAQLALLTDFDPQPYIVASSHGFRATPWAIAMDSNTGANDIASDPDEYFRTVVSWNSRNPSSGDATTFIMLPWNQPRSDTDEVVQTLLIETSLLPTDVVTAVTP